MCCWSCPKMAIQLFFVRPAGWMKKSYSTNSSIHINEVNEWFPPLLGHYFLTEAPATVRIRWSVSIAEKIFNMILCQKSIKQLGSVKWRMPTHWSDFYQCVASFICQLLTWIFYVFYWLNSGSTLFFLRWHFCWMLPMWCEECLCSVHFM